MASLAVSSPLLCSPVSYVSVPVLTLFSTRHNYVVCMDKYGLDLYDLTLGVF